MVDDALFLMSGGGERSDWVRNMKANPSVRVRIAHDELEGTAQVAPDLDEQPIRAAMAAKYQGWRPGEQLSDWARSAVIVRIEPRS